MDSGGECDRWWYRLIAPHPLMCGTRPASARPRVARQTQGGPLAPLGAAVGTLAGAQGTPRHQALVAALQQLMHGNQLAGLVDAHQAHVEAFGQQTIDQPIPVPRRFHGHSLDRAGQARSAATIAASELGRRLRYNS